VIMGGLFVCRKVFKSESFRATINSPWKLIGWMILFVPLFFVCLLVVLLLVPMFARMPGDVVILDYDQKYPVESISTETSNGDSKRYHVRSRPFKFKLTPGEHALRITFRSPDGSISFTKNVDKKSGKYLAINIAPDIKYIVLDEKRQSEESAERKMNRGGILLSGQTPGLRVGVFPVDSMQAGPEDGTFGFADRFYVLEPTTYEVPAGFYEIKVSSTDAGWIVDTSNPQYSFTTIEVKPGQIFSVEISRDFKILAENQPNWSMDALFQFVWPVNSKTKTSKRFKLSVQDAKVVQQLLEAFAEGEADVAESDLLKTANTGLDTGLLKSLKQKFNNGKHPAWGTLVVPGKAEKTYRLAEPNFRQ